MKSWGLHLHQVKIAYVPTQCLLLPVFDLLKTKWYEPVAWSQCFGKRLLIRGQPPIDLLYSRYWQSRGQLKMKKTLFWRVKMQIVHTELIVYVTIFIVCIKTYALDGAIHEPRTWQYWLGMYFAASFSHQRGQRLFNK